VTEESRLLLAAHGRVPRVSVFGVLARWIGLSLWSSARAETLPTAPLAEGGEESAPSHRAGLRVVTVVLLVLAAAILALGFFVRRELSSAREILVANPEHLSLLESADRVERLASRSFFLRFYPGSAPRLRQAAARIRTGREALIEAARQRTLCAAAMDSLGLLGRLARGRGALAPLRRALDQVRVPYLQSTLTYRELQELIAAYAAERTPGTIAVKGTLAAAPPGHGLLLSAAGSGREGTVLAVVRQVGDRLEVALEPGMRVRLTDIESRGGSPEVVEDWEVAVESWNERGFAFPRSGSFFRVRLDPESEAPAPPIRPLSDAARDELAPLPAGVK
jgi:hypothetical protein